MSRRALQLLPNLRRHKSQLRSLRLRPKDNINSGRLRIDHIFSSLTIFVNITRR